jgi:hypothetical protein
MNQDDSTKFVDEFLAGQYACECGEPCQENASEYFRRGYSAQYQHEQNMDAMTSEQANG